MNRTYQIPAENLDGLCARIEKINARCEKLGFPPVELRDLGSEMREFDTDGIKRLVKVHTIEIEGETPQIDGWTFRATLTMSLLNCRSGMLPGKADFRF